MSIDKDYNPDDIKLPSPNEDLMDRRNLPEENRKLLQVAYTQMGTYIHRPEMYENVVEKIEALEYVMQFLWQFDMDKRFHSYWNEIKGCTCPPKIDNDELFGTGMRWSCGNGCRWHNSNV